ncbi:MAG: DUF4145 domain-containing protein [Polyangiales bacterium]
MTDHGEHDEERRSSPERFDQLVQQLVSELDLCAQVRWDDSVTFAWRARRCVEVILLAVLAKHSPQSLATLRNPTIDSLVRHDKLKREAPNSPISKDIFNVVDAVQGFGNTAAHYQLETVEHEENAVDVARALTRLVEWFHRSHFGQVPSETQRLLDSIRDRSLRVTNASQRAVESMRKDVEAREAEHARWERTLRHERDQARARLAEVEGALHDARTQLAALEHARSEAHARIDLLERRLSEAPASRAANDASAGRGLWRGAALVSVLVGLVVGAVLFKLFIADSPRSPRDARDATSATQAQGDAGPIERGVTAPSPVAVLAVAPEPVRGDAGIVAQPCPEGFVFYDAREVALQPWPAGARPWGRVRHPGQVSRYPVAPFCLQQRAETIGAVQQFRPALLRPAPGCARLPGGDGQRVTCVLHQEAEDYCASRWRGRLPTVLEWEAATRAVEQHHSAEVQRWRRSTDASQAELSRQQNELEWVADGFPATPFDLGAAQPGVWMARAPIPQVPWEGTFMRQSWNRRAEGRDMYIGFRCAVPPR